MMDLIYYLWKIYDAVFKNLFYGLFLLFMEIPAETPGCQAEQGTDNYPQAQVVKAQSVARGLESIS